MGYPLIAIHKRMVHGERETEGCGLAYERGVQVRAAKRVTGLGQRGLKHPKISNAGCASGMVEHGLVQI